jgi:hypothetical protein
LPVWLGWQSLLNERTGLNDLAGLADHVDGRDRLQALSWTNNLSMSLQLTFKTNVVGSRARVESLALVEPS